MRIFFYTLLLAGFCVRAQTNFQDLLDNGVPKTRMPWMPASATGDMSTATNLIHFLVIQVNGDYTVTAAEANAMWTTNVIYKVNTAASNIALTFPATFPNTFKAINAGTNQAIMTAANGNTFMLAPAGGGISYMTTLVNKDVLKCQEFFMLTATNCVVSGDFRPLPNFIYNVTNNLPLLTALAAGDGSALSGVTAAVPASATNLFLITIPVSATNLFLITIPTSATNQFLVTIPTGATNSFLVTVPSSATNQMTRTNDATWFDAKGAATASTNGFPWGSLYYGAANPSGFISTVPASATNTFTRTFSTNFVSGVPFTNNYGREIDVSVVVTNICPPAAIGRAGMELWLAYTNGGVFVAVDSRVVGTFALSLGSTNQVLLKTSVPTNGVIVFTNLSSGGNNNAVLRNNSGQIVIK